MPLYLVYSRTNLDRQQTLAIDPMKAQKGFTLCAAWSFTKNRLPPRNR